MNQPIFEQAQYGTQPIGYRVCFKPRKTLAIHVHPDGSVWVDAPEGTALEQIRARVIRRGRWITRQQRELATYPPPLPERKYVSGEGIRYLGKQYRLKVEPAERNSVGLVGGYLNVETADPKNPAQTAKLIKGWLRKQAHRILAERLEECALWVRRVGLEQPVEFEIREMQKRWGSCTPSGRILLNPILIAAPKDCIDYVIVHELCHLLEANHKPRFYRLLEEVLPNWKQLRKKLNRVVETLA